MGLSGLLSASTSADAGVGGLASANGSSRSLPRPKISSRQSSSQSNIAAEPPSIDYISDDSQLVAPAPPHPDLRQLNNALEALAAVFPDIQIEVFRELLSHFDGESRLALCADALLKNRATWVKGRWRVDDNAPDKNGSAHKGVATRRNQLHDGLRGTVPPTEVFRSDEYKRAVKALAATEFKGLSRSAISAVLAESNYCYLESRQTLQRLSSKSWRYAFQTFFFRRKGASSSTSASGAAESENDPLITWRSTGHGSIIPTVRSTGHAELDRELYDAIIRPLKARLRSEQEAKDRALASLLNNEEAEEAEATHECACCFATYAFEEITTCSGTEGHLVCFRCVQHSVREAVFGQGWHASIDPAAGTLRCMAVVYGDSSSNGRDGLDGGGCAGHVPAEQLQRAMAEEKKGIEILRRLDARLAEHSLLKSKLPLVRCPFCDYAEVDDIYLPMQEAQLRVRANSLLNLLFLVLCIGAIPFLLSSLLLSFFVCILMNSKETLGDRLRSEWDDAVNRYRRRRRGSRFSCQNPSCQRDSCLSCSKAWVDVHVCNESSLIALRTQVEQAMSLAVKRVCPHCNTSFVKSQGCNKLTCPCGYKMCYVCRKDLGGANGEGYRHFCDHFRPDGDPKPCTQCDKCNLWESENTELVLRQAREEAESKWREAENRELTGAEKAFLETGIATRRGLSAKGILRGELPTVAEICDLLVETIFM